VNDLPPPAATDAPPRIMLQLGHHNPANDAFGRWTCACRASAIGNGHVQPYGPAVTGPRCPLVPARVLHQGEKIVLPDGKDHEIGTVLLSHLGGGGDGFLKALIDLAEDWEARTGPQDGWPDPAIEEEDREFAAAWGRSEQTAIRYAAARDEDLRHNKWWDAIEERCLGLVRVAIGGGVLVFRDQYGICTEPDHDCTADDDGPGGCTGARKGGGQ
jgi:hypothetical protein